MIEQIEWKRVYCIHSDVNILSIQVHWWIFLLSELELCDITWLCKQRNIFTQGKLELQL